MGPAVLPIEDWWKVAKGQYGSNRIVLFKFFAVYTPIKNRVATFEGSYGSSTYDMVHGVQKDNLVHKNNTGWNSGTISTSRLLIMLIAWWFLRKPSFHSPHLKWKKEKRQFKRLKLLAMFSGRGTSAPNLQLSTCTMVIQLAM